jgi:hypothetical protein
VRRAVRRYAALFVVGIVAVVGVAAGVAGARNGTGPGGPAVSDQRQREITAAATEFGVPAPLLTALAWVLSGGTAGSTDGGYGLFRLADRPAALDGRAGADPRGPLARRAAATDPAAAALPAAARLAAATTTQVRTDPAQNARAAAALLRAYAVEATGGKLPDRLVGWYGTVARFATGDAMTGRAVADDVFAVLRAGVRPTVVGGQRFAVPAQPAAALTTAPGAVVTGECPAAMSCRLVPAAGYAPADRTAVRLAVLSTAPAGYTATIAAAQRASARWSPHYVVRAADGAVTQTVLLRDVAWHTGNPSVDAGAVSIAVEADPSPAAYRSVAALLRWLAGRGLPLDRQHVLGADEVAGAPVPLAAGFDWGRVLTAAGAPLTAAAFRADRVVVVAKPGLVLREAPGGAALASQPAVGRALPVAGSKPGWTSVWYGGRAAWFPAADTARTLPGDLPRVTPALRGAGVPVRGSAGGAQLGTLPAGQAAVLLDPEPVGDSLVIGYGDTVGYVRSTDVTLALG